MEKIFSDHTRILVKNAAEKTYKSPTAGAYQVMSYTRDDPKYVSYRKKYGIVDFTDASQGIFAFSGLILEITLRSKIRMVSVGKKASALQCMGKSP